MLRSGTTLKQNNKINPNVFFVKTSRFLRTYYICRYYVEEVEVKITVVVQSSSAVAEYQ